MSDLHEVMFSLFICSELIRRYQEKVSDCEVWQQELREAQSKVTALNQGMVGLRAEMQAMHEVGSL